MAAFKDRSGACLCPDALLLSLAQLGLRCTALPVCSRPRTAQIASRLMDIKVQLEEWQGSNPLWMTARHRGREKGEDEAGEEEGGVLICSSRKEGLASALHSIEQEMGREKERESEKERAMEGAGLEKRGGGKGEDAECQESNEKRADDKSTRV